MQSPCNFFTLSLSGSDSRKSNKLARRQRCYDGDQRCRAGDDGDHYRLDNLISIIASLSSRQLLLLRLSLPPSDKVKQIQGVCISYNKATTIWLLPVADNSVTKHDHLIQQIISHHVLTISHHNMPCKNKLDVLYLVVANFTWLLRA